jgi:hypothetical protein
MIHSDLKTTGEVVIIASSNVLPRNSHGVTETDHETCFIQESNRVTREYEGVTKSFRTGHLQREQQMVELSANRCSFIAIL